MQEAVLGLQEAVLGLQEGGLREGGHSRNPLTQPFFGGVGATWNRINSLTVTRTCLVRCLELVSAARLSQVAVLLARVVGLG